MPALTLLGGGGGRREERWPRGISVAGRWRRKIECWRIGTLPHKGHFNADTAARNKKPPTSCYSPQNTVKETGSLSLFLFPAAIK